MYVSCRTPPQLIMTLFSISAKFFLPYNILRLIKVCERVQCADIFITFLCELSVADNSFSIIWWQTMAQLVGLDYRDNDTQGHLNNCTREHVLSLSKKLIKSLWRFNFGILLICCLMSHHIIATFLIFTRRRWEAMGFAARSATKFSIHGWN